MTEGAKNDKYVVFKRGDFEAWVAGSEGIDPDVNHQVELLREMELTGAEVIRHQDLLAAPLFHLYSSLMVSQIELNINIGMTFSNDSLQKAADHFHEAAIKSEQHPHRRMPD